jgi:LmbE family N-acetylglucosaminyl deacetylase
MTTRMTQTARTVFMPLGSATSAAPESLDVHTCGVTQRYFPDLGTILAFFAHPDDESYCCAGIMSEAIRNGQRVVCVTATRGELGSTDEERWPPGPPLADVRTRELAACLDVIGVTEHHWWDYPDGGCADVDDRVAISRLRDLMDDVEPDTILTFAPDGATFHPDHISVSRWATRAARGTSADVHYAVNTQAWFDLVTQWIDPSMVMMAEGLPEMIDPDQASILGVLQDDLLDMKYRAMLCQESQVGPLIQLAGIDGYKQLIAEESFRQARDTDWA